MLGLLANIGQFSAFAKLVGLAPFILKFVEVAERTGKPGADKRAMVIGMVKAVTDEFERRGQLPPEFGESLEKVAGELTDVIVAIYNAWGVFDGMRQPSSKKKGK